MAAIFVYTKMHAKKWWSETVRALKIEKIILFVAHHSIFTSVFPSNCCSFMINISLVSKNVTLTQLVNSNLAKDSEDTTEQQPRGPS